jgi:hypothetical protein
MPPVLTTLSSLSKASVAGAIATIIACGLGRWQLVVTLSRATLVGGLVTFLASAVVLVAFPAVIVPALEPVEKATMLARGLSELMNSGALACLAFASSAVLWRVGRRRLRTESAR